MQSMLNNQKEQPAAPKLSGAQDEVQYCIGKQVFIVSPVYRQHPGKTIHGKLLDLIKKDAENH